MKLLVAQPIIDHYFADVRLLNQPKKLVIILVGDDKASQIFVDIKTRQAARYGVEAEVLKFPATAKQKEIIAKIEALNDDEAVDAIIVQIPLPGNLNIEAVVQSIVPGKDVDDLSGKGRFVSPMVQAVDALAKFYQIDFTDKKIVVVGNGRLIGQPIYRWLEKQKLNFTVVDVNTQNNNEKIRSADIIIAGTGVDDLIDDLNTRAGQIIFDCSGRDVAFDLVKEKAAAITPRRGAIGPLTVHFLFQNVLATS